MSHDAEKERKYIVEYLKEVSSNFLDENNKDFLHQALPESVRFFISKGFLAAAEQIEKGNHIPSEEDLLMKNIKNIIEHLTKNNELSKIPLHEILKITISLKNMNCEDKKSCGPQLKEIYEIIKAYAPEYINPFSDTLN